MTPTHPIAQALADIVTALHQLEHANAAARAAQAHAVHAIKRGLSAYAATCHHFNLPMEHRIAIGDAVLEIDEEWYECPELKAVTLHSTPPTLAAVVQAIPQQAAA